MRPVISLAGPLRNSGGAAGISIFSLRKFERRPPESCAMELDPVVVGPLRRALEGAGIAFGDPTAGDRSVRMNPVPVGMNRRKLMLIGIDVAPPRPMFEATASAPQRWRKDSETPCPGSHHPAASAVNLRSL